MPESRDLAQHSAKGLQPTGPKDQHVAPASEKNSDTDTFGTYVLAHRRREVDGWAAEDRLLRLHPRVRLRVHRRPREAGSSRLRSARTLGREMNFPSTDIENSGSQTGRRFDT